MATDSTVTPDETRERQQVEYHAAIAYQYIASEPTIFKKIVWFLRGGRPGARVWLVPRKVPVHLHEKILEEVKCIAGRKEPILNGYEFILKNIDGTIFEIRTTLRFTPKSR